MLLIHLFPQTLCQQEMKENPEDKVYEDNMGPTWGQEDQGGSHVGPINLAIWEGKVDWENGKWSCVGNFVCVYYSNEKWIHNVIA